MVSCRAVLPCSDASLWCKYEANIVGDVFLGLNGWTSSWFARYCKTSRVLWFFSCHVFASCGCGWVCYLKFGCRSCSCRACRGCSSCSIVLKWVKQCQTLPLGSLWLADVSWKVMSVPQGQHYSPRGRQADHCKASRIATQQTGFHFFSGTGGLQSQCYHGKLWDPESTRMRLDIFWVLRVFTVLWGLAKTLSCDDLSALSWEKAWRTRTGPCRDCSCWE